MKIWWNIAILGLVLGLALVMAPRWDPGSNSREASKVQEIRQPASVHGSSPSRQQSPPTPSISRAPANAAPRDRTEDSQALSVDGVELFPPRERSEDVLARIAHLRPEGKFRDPGPADRSEIGRRVIFFDGDRMRRAHEVWERGVQKIIDGESGEILFQRDRRIF